MEFVFKSFRKILNFKISMKESKGGSALSEKNDICVRLNLKFPAIHYHGGFTVCFEIFESLSGFLVIWGFP